MRILTVTLFLMLVAALPGNAVEFLGVELCKGSVDTSVVLPVGSPLSLESTEIGRHGGLLMLLKADNGDVMDHIDNLMAFYTDSRGTGDSKKLQWTGNGITAYAQLIKKGFAALAVSTEDNCDGEDAATIMGGEGASEEAATVAPEAVIGTSGAIAAQPELNSGGDPAPVAEISTPEPEAAAAVVEAAPVPMPVPVPVPAPAPVEDFVLKGKLKHSHAEEMWVDVMGVVVNNSGSGYHIANFDLSLYDGSGDLICVDAISVSQLRDGQERAFRDSIRCEDYNESLVVNWKLQFAGGR